MNIQLSISQNGITRLPKEFLENFGIVGKKAKLELVVKKDKAIVKSVEPIWTELKGSLKRKGQKALSSDELDEELENIIVKDSL